MQTKMLRAVRLRAPLALVLVLVFSVSLRADDLRRRGLMGVQLRPIDDELAKSLNLATSNGILVLGAMPGTAAAEAGLQPNDVLKSIDGEDVPTFDDGLRLLRKYYAGDTLKLGLIREGKPVETNLTLRERPRETSEKFDIVYDTAGEPGHRVRTYITKPKESGKHPAILFVQSLNPGPMEFPNEMMARHPYKLLVDNLAQAGFVVMRVERPGNGDSEGTDPTHPKLADDMTAFNAALKKLGGYDYVDPQQVFVFAQSTGTAIAPALAQVDGVRGVITYAAIARPWTEHLPETMARRWKFELLPEEELKGNVEKTTTFVRECIVGGKNPKDVFEAHPELREFAESLGVQEEEYIMGSHYAYWQEMAALDLPAQWKQVGRPVLVLWGECDFMAGRACSELVAQSVNAEHPGMATFMPLAGIDHNYAPMEDQEESFLANFTGEFNPVLVEAVKKWVSEVGSARTS